MAAMKVLTTFDKKPALLKAGFELLIRDLKKKKSYSKIILVCFDTNPYYPEAHPFKDGLQAVNRRSKHEEKL